MRTMVRVVAGLWIAANLIMAAAPAQAHRISAGHAAARRGLPYPTQHVNEIYVSITQVKAVREASDSSHKSDHQYLTIFLRIQNHNDVIIYARTSWFSAMDQLDQPAQTVDECSTNYLTNDSGEVARLASSFQPRVCSTTFDKNNNDYLNPEQSVAGSIAFEVPKGQHHATLTWAPEGSMNSGITFPAKTWSINY